MLQLGVGCRSLGRGVAACGATPQVMLCGDTVATTAVYRLHAKVYRLHAKVYRLHAKVYRLHAKVYRLHAKVYRLHAKVYRLHAKVYIHAKVGTCSGCPAMNM